MKCCATGGVLILGLVGLFSRRNLMTLALVLYFIGYAVTGPEAVQVLLHSRALALRDLSLPFFVGVLFYVWREKIELSYLIMLIGLIGVLLLAGTSVFEGLFALVLAYSVFVVAYLPKGFVRQYNKIGDYSYGLYIYAFPIQQLAVYLFAEMTPLQNMAFSLPFALFLAFLSWHFVEKPSMAKRHEVSDFIAKFLPK